MNILITEQQFDNIIGKQLLSEDFKSQKQRFISQGYDESIVNDYLAYFKEIKDKKYKQVFDNIHGVNVTGNNRINIDAYKEFKELELVVDYVRGQVKITGGKIDETLVIDGKPVFENDNIEIYYADSAHACIKYKGNVPYSWCVSRRDSSNMYTTYRYREHQPAFYFVKLKDRTKKQLGALSLLKTSFDGKFNDPYHFFVVQVVYNADVNNKEREQYLVTSANNDGDKQMSWDDIVSIDPRLGRLQEIFKPVPHSEQEKKDWSEFRKGIDDEVYCKLPYERKRTYLDIIGIKKGLSDGQWNCTPYDLKNLYVSFGIDLTKHQFEDIKKDSKLLKRYKEISERALEEYIKETISDFGNTQYLVLSDDKKLEYLKKRISRGHDLSDEQYKYAPDNLKLEYLKKRISRGHDLSDEQYKYTPDNLKLEYLKTKISNAWHLSDEEFDYVPDNLKLEYIKKRILIKGPLSDKEYDYAPDNLKLEYIKIRISRGYHMSDAQYKSLPANLKLEYIRTMTSNGYGISNGQYKYTPDNLKMEFIKMRILKGLKLIDEQFNLTPDNLKLVYIKMVILNGYYMSDAQFDYAPDKLKLEYIKKIISIDRIITDAQFDYAPDNLKLEYIKMAVSKDKHLSDGQNNFAIQHGLI